MSDSSESKTDPASSRKLKKQREKGVLSQAAEMSNYASQLLAILVLLVSVRWILSVMHLGIDNAIITMDYPLDIALEEGSENSVRIFLFAAAPIAFVALTSGVLIKLMYQKGFVFSTDPIIPKLDKISPSKGLKRIFGMRGWVELGMAIGRLIVWSGAFLVITYMKFLPFLAAVPCGLPCIVEVGLETMQLLLAAACVLFLVFTIVEGIMQNSIFAHEQRMTKTEVNRERKDQFGSKEVRSARKRFQKELQNSADSIGVNNATMVVFFGDQAVALRFHPVYAPMPMLSAKATSRELSTAMRDQVRQNGWEEAENEALVKGLIGSRPGVSVPKELHGALGAALVIMYG